MATSVRRSCRLPSHLDGGSRDASRATLVCNGKALDSPNPTFLRDDNDRRQSKPLRRRRNNRTREDFPNTSPTEPDTVASRLASDRDSGGRSRHIHRHELIAATKWQSVAGKTTEQFGEIVESSDQLLIASGRFQRC